MRVVILYYIHTQIDFIFSEAREQIRMVVRLKASKKDKGEREIAT